MMRKTLLALAVLGLAAMVVAQTPQTLEAVKKAAVEAKFDTTTDTQALPATGPLTKPVMLFAKAGKMTAKWHTYYKAESRMQAGLLHGRSYHWTPAYYGAYLANSGKALGEKDKAAQARGFDQQFKYTFDTGKPLDGKLKVYFSGYAYGGAQVAAQFGNDSWKNDPQKPGSFSFKKEYPVSQAAKIAETFMMKCDTGAVKDKAHYSAKLYIYFYPTVPQPTLAWSVPTQKKNCGKGLIGTKGTVGFGQKFEITLTGADDAATKEPMAMLFTGDSVTQWWFLPLPIDLAFAGATGCELRVAIVHARPAKIDNKAASFPMMVSSFHQRYFKTAYFQIGYTTDISSANTLGMVFTDYGMLEKK